MPATESAAGEVSFRGHTRAGEEQSVRRCSQGGQKQTLIMADKSTGNAGKIWQAKKGKVDLGTPCGDKHEWKQMSDYVKHCRKYRCEREGCGFFKKCWTACNDIDCKGCHVPGHKRW